MSSQDCVQSVDLPEMPTDRAQIIHSKQKITERIGENQRPGDTNNRRDLIRPRYNNTLHLWEFLLQLLNDESAKSIIGWSRKEYGEFRIKDQKQVAKRWGALRNRPGMTYDKLSRAIRSYYSRQIITKVPGQKLVYKFDKLPYEYMPEVVESYLTKRRHSEDTNSNQQCTQLSSPSHMLTNDFNFLSLSTAASTTATISQPLSRNLTTSSAGNCYRFPLDLERLQRDNLKLKLPHGDLDECCYADEPQSAPPDISTAKCFSFTSDKPAPPFLRSLERRKSIPVSVITKNTSGCETADVNLIIADKRPVSNS